MNRKKGGLTAARVERAAFCHDCELWPAPVQWSPAVRLCEKCAEARRAASEGVSSVTHQ